MAFTDPIFSFFFLPLVLLIFWQAGKRLGRIASHLTLLLASIVFYAGFGARELALLAASIGVNAAAGLYLARASKPAPRPAAFALAAGQAWNLGTLVWFKYLGGSPPISGAGSMASFVHHAIPMGISFYTFHQAVFLVDAYNRKPEVLAYLGESGLRGRLRALVRYASFICFFPQLVIGPIAYLKEFAASVQRRHFGRIRRLDLEIGYTLIAIGLFKKLVLANGLEPISMPPFSAAGAGTVPDFAHAWLGVAAYYFQLYFDFSGYSDIALGAARLFGIRLPSNFDSPLRATGIRDFYARWHMTLTRIMIRFVFTPLALWGTRATIRPETAMLVRKLASSWLPLFATFLLIALWHGAAATFLLFGVIHGIWNILETEIVGTRRWKAWAKTRSPAYLRIRGQLLTMVPLMLTFALFNAHGLRSLAFLLRGLVAPAHGYDGQLALDALKVALAAAIVWLAPNSIELLRRYRPVILTRVNPSTTPAAFALTWRPSIGWGLAITALAVLSVIFIQPSTFIYQGF